MYEPNGKPGGKHSMTAFWAVIGLAAVLLIVFFKGGLVSRPVFSGGLLAQGKRKAAPDFLLKEAGGSATVAPGDIAGKVAVLHFWATWCPPCRAEFPEFSKYALAVKDRPGLAVLPVSLDDSPSVVPPFVARNGNGIEAYTDGGKLAGALGVASIPQTVLLDKSGRIAYEAVGGQDWSGTGVPKLVEELSHE